MGPSLLEERRRRRAVQTGLVAGAVALAAVVSLVFVVISLGREVVIMEQPQTRTAIGASAPVVTTVRPEPLRLAQVPAEGSEQPLAVQLPINLRGVTAIGYGRRADSTALQLEPEGSRANMPSGEQLLRKFLATRPASEVRWISLTKSRNPNVVYVGARPGSQIYAPVSGTVVALTDYVINDRAQGKVVQLQPLGDPETLLVLRNLDAAPSLAVGQSVSAGATLLGAVRDMEGVIAQPLARYTLDTGSCLEVYVRRVVPLDPVA
jgi:hypothetical protein